MASSMNKAEMDQFLQDLHVAIISIPLKSRGPLTVPIWYVYEPGGEVSFMTFRDSWKAKLLQMGIRISLCVQDENPPYKFVSIEGPVVGIHDADLEREIRPMVYRYLGQEGGDRYIQETYPNPEDPGELYVRIKPERWYS